MFSQELNQIIEAALTDGVLTDQERAVIRKRALLEGIDPDEVDVMLDAKIQQMEQKAAQEALSKVRKFPACGSIVANLQTKCPTCGHEFSNVQANKSIQKLADMINEFNATEVVPEKREQRITSMIKSFPIPTSKEDILEFLFMAVPNAKPVGGFLAKKGMNLLLPGVAAFVIFFIVGCIAEGFDMGLVLGVSLSVPIGVLGYNILKKVLKDSIAHNKMAGVWRLKAEQVLAKAKFALRNDEDAMATINDFEQQLK